MNNQDDVYYMCIAKCPELDEDGTKHCRQSMTKLESCVDDYCPAGNFEYWWNEDQIFVILVVGSRNITNYELVKFKLDGLINELNTHIFGVDYKYVIVSGGAAGVDSLAKQYATENNYQYREFPADWNKHGKSAGYIRNTLMHKYISNYKHRMCVAFWDGESKGTAHNFELAKKYNNDISVIKVPAAMRSGG